MPTPRVTIDALPLKAVPETDDGLIIQDSGITKRTTIGGFLTLPSAELTAHLTDTTDAHDASAISATDSTNGINGPTVQAQLGQLATAASKPQLFRSQNTATYTFALDDQGRMVLSLGNVPALFSIPLDAVVNWPMGSWFDVAQTGTGKLTLDIPGGSIAAAGPTSIRAQYGHARAIKVAPNVWLMYGDLG